MGLFSKKNCSICGGDIGLLGNTKLADGNLCKHCVAKLSPFFHSAKSSTISQIEEQLAYREANQEAVSAFHITRTLGKSTKVHIDEDAMKFVVTSASSLQTANPDVMNISDVTNVVIDVDERKDEQKTRNPEGNYVSFNPPHYKYHYSFNVIINVNSPYFNEIRISLGSATTEGMRTAGAPVGRPGIAGRPPRMTGPETETKPNPMTDVEYKELSSIAEEIKKVLMDARSDARKTQKAAAVVEEQKHQVECPCCGAKTMPDAKNCCEYCGTFLG